MDKRRYHRVKCDTPGELIHHDMKYECRLENLSLRGALISANECIMVPQGDSCTFTVPLEPGAPPVVISVIVVHCFFSMVGVQFVSFCDDAECRVLDFMKKTTTEPLKLMQEWENIQEYRDSLHDVPLHTASAAAAP